MSFGAFGAHGLRSRFPEISERNLTSWATASNYLVYNGLALLALSLHPNYSTANKKFRTAAGLIIGGATVFSGTIFGLVLAKDKVGKVFGPLTPLAGMAMIGG
jgi:uncharacterized membrane protein YgdD (TMEM256/DUF423 family)